MKSKEVLQGIVDAYFKENPEVEIVYGLDNGLLFEKQNNAVYHGKMYGLKPVTYVREKKEEIKSKKSLKDGSK